jgi:hypothetical protein
MPKFPHIEVKLVGEDGNAFAILGRMMRALKQGGVDKADIDEFQKEATSGDFDRLLRTCIKWVEVV